MLSPGPGRPEEAKTAQLLVQRLAGHLPILGVCLGCQVIATAFGARVIRAPRPAHRYILAVEHDGQGVFAGLPNPLTVTRYHSLVVDPASVPDCLAITAWTAGPAAGTADPAAGRRHDDERQALPMSRSSWAFAIVTCQLKGSNFIRRPT